MAIDPSGDRPIFLSVDVELLAVWLKSHADGSPHTARVYQREGARFVEALATTGTDLRQATRVGFTQFNAAPLSSSSRRRRGSSPSASSVSSRCTC